MRIIVGTNNYIELQRESNSYRNKIIEIPKAEYKTVYGENIKGIMFKNKFYTKSEYEEMLRLENDTYKKRIAEIEQKIQDGYIDNKTTN